MLNLIARFRALLRNDKGQDLIEYALLAGLIALVAVVAGNAGTEVNAIWEDIVTGPERSLTSAEASGISPFPRR